MGLLSRLRRRLYPPSSTPPAPHPSDVASCSTSPLSKRSATERAIFALAHDIDYVPTDLAERRIVDCLKRIAQGQVPVYHPKMREVDVQALELYRQRLLERQRQRTAERARRASSRSWDTDILMTVSESVLRLGPINLM